MNQPPEYAPHRTETQILGDDIAQAMRNLRRDWPHMLPKGPPAIHTGRSGGGGVLLADDDRSDADTPRNIRILSTRRNVQDVLNSWCRLVVEDRGVTNHIPAGTDVPGMATFMERHADWLSGHEAAQEARDELRALARDCGLIVTPFVRDWVSIGRCPLEQPFGPEEVLEECGGDVKVRPKPGQRPTDADGTCSRCGEEADAKWWADRMFVNGEGSPLVTIGELVAVIAYRLEVVVTHDQIRQWKHRGKIESAGTDNKGRTLYRHEQVVDSIRAEARAKAAKAASA